MLETPILQSEAPWIGLGCGAFGGSCSAATSRRILDASYEAGIRHFDTASSYGFGLSEKIVGEWLATIDRRSVTVATKFGKAVVKQNPIKRWLRGTLSSVLRPLKRVGKSRRFATSESHRQTVSSVDVSALRASIRQSLESLRVEYVDVLHLHSVSPEAVDPEVQDALEEMINAGQIRLIGLATNRSDCVKLIDNGLPVSAVQFPDSAWWDHPLRWRQPSTQTVITHSVLGRDGTVRSSLANWLAKSAADRKIWTRRLGVSAESKEGVAELLVRGAMARNKSGGVLCGVSRVSQVAMLGRVLQNPLSDEDDVSLLEMLLRFASSAQ